MSNLESLFKIIFQKDSFLKDQGYLRQVIIVLDDGIMWQVAGLASGLG